MLSQYTRLVKEDCVMSGVEIAYQLNKVKSHQPYFSKTSATDFLQVDVNSFQWCKALDRNQNVTDAVVFVEKSARLCRIEGYCHVGKLQNTVSMHFWDVYSKIVPETEFVCDIARIAGLLHNEDNASVTFRRTLNTLAKGAYAPSVFPQFTAIYYELLRHCMHKDMMPKSMQFLYKTLLREFAEADFEITPVCVCCYRRVCTIEILEALPRDIWDFEPQDPFSSDSQDECDAGAWFDGWARRELLQEGLNDFYIDFLSGLNLTPGPNTMEDIELFCQIIRATDIDKTDIKSFLTGMKLRAPNLLPVHMKYWYTILSDLMTLCITKCELPCAVSESEYIIACELLLSIWKACEEASGGSGNVGALKCLVANTLIREICKMSPLLSMWSAGVLAKSLHGFNHYEGLEIGIVYVIRCMLSLSINSFDDVIHVKNALQNVLQSFSVMLNFRDFLYEHSYEQSFDDVVSAIGSDTIEYF